LAGVEHDANDHPAPVGVDQGVDDRPIGQRIGRHVYLRVGRTQQVDVNALEVLGRSVMDFDVRGSGRRRADGKECVQGKRQRKAGANSFSFRQSHPPPFRSSPSSFKNEYRTKEAMLATRNLFANVPERLIDEEITILVEFPGARIERIVSTGQASQPGFWCDQEQAEWVVLLRGSAGLLFEGEAAPRSLRPGDYVEIPAHARHRVEWTDANEATVWLAVHVGGKAG
jgi:cupin 2 domain-containing protein